MKSFLCVNHYATIPVPFERYRGFAEVIGADFKASTLDTGADPDQIEAKASAYLRHRKGTQAVLSLGPISAHASMKALQKMGLETKVFFATFDLSEEIAKGIKHGRHPEIAVRCERRNNVAKDLT